MGVDDVEVRFGQRMAFKSMPEPQEVVAFGTGSREVGADKTAVGVAVVEGAFAGKPKALLGEVLHPWYAGQHDGRSPGYAANGVERRDGAFEFGLQGQRFESVEENVVPCARLARGVFQVGRIPGWRSSFASLGVRNRDVRAGRINQRFLKWPGDSCGVVRIPGVRRAGREWRATKPFSASAGMAVAWR